MNPQEERKLIEEVIYLHSLWHQGPPSPCPTPTPNPLHLASAPQPYIPHYQRHYPIPTHPFAPTHTRSLPPITTTFHKRNHINKRKKKKRKRKDPTNNIRQPDPPQSPGPDWPCPDTPDPPPTGWPALKRSLVTHAVSVSPQEKERLVALQAQNKACQTFRDFLMDSDEDDDDDDGDDDDDEDVGDDGWEELEEFFVKVFMEDNELRGYYQRCSESGEFCCLVCGAIGKKNSGKKFKDCVALVQHSMSVSRTVKKRAHRAFGMAVCKVLGWDIDRLPTIVMKGEPLGCSKGMKPSKEEGEAKESATAADDGKDGAHKSNDKVVSLENDDEPVQKHAQLVDQGISEDEHETPADGHVDDSSVLQENQAK